MARKIAGCMWGLALGDALGKPVEFLPYPRIVEHHGPAGITNVPRNGIWTDDTEMTIAVAKGLLSLDPNGASIEATGAAIAREYVAWLDHPGHAPGQTCRRGASRLKGGVDWHVAGIEDSKGCGAAMRVAPIGFFFDDLPTVVQVAVNSSLPTHRHPTALASAAGAAALVYLAMDGVPVHEWGARVKKIIQGLDGVGMRGKNEFTVAIDRAIDVLDVENPPEALSYIGEGWIAEEAVALALHCCMRFPGPEQFKQMLLTAVNHSGDSDSVGCIAGGIMGAFHGFSIVEILVKTWLDNLRPDLSARMSDLVGKLEERLSAKGD